MVMPVEPIKALFLVPVAAVGLAACVASPGYLAGERAGALVRYWTCLLATLASMTAVVFSPGKISFLLAWEAMGLFSAALVAFDSAEKAVRNAAWNYLLACQAGAFALMLAGVAMGSESTMLAAFFLALVGFGLKIGFPPFHVWLPEAHPAAPAPASAVMSGAMIPLGFYGLARFFAMSGWGASGVPSACGWSILVLGAIGAVGGSLFAMQQNNLKRLLAFSSIENMGVIAIGMGLALAADGDGYRDVRSFAFVGAVLHILNHAFLKGALFIGAGSVLRSTGTLEIDRLGGLMRRMPLAGSLFTFNALGLSGLPPLNAFFGELLIYAGAFYALKSGDPALTLAGFIALVTLSLAGGLAAAGYLKAVGCAFLGEPRSSAAAEAKTPRFSLTAAQLVLTALSVAMLPVSVAIAHCATQGDADGIMVSGAVAGAAAAATALALALLRRFVAARGGVRPMLPTWDCGYDAPTARMAYTGTAFAQPAAQLFAPVLRQRRHAIPFRGDPSAPTDAAVAIETDDRALAGLWRPLFTAVARLFQRGHLLQNGSLHLYILLVLLALVALVASAVLS